MKPTKTTSYLALMGLVMGSSLASLKAADIEVFTPNPPSSVVPVPFVNSGSTWYLTEDFTTFEGTSTSLPAGIIANGVYKTGDFSGLQWNGFNDGTSDLAGFFSYANPVTGSPSPSNPSHWDTARSFGFHEESGIKDTRMFLKFKNTTGSDLSRVIMNYTVQQWRKGSRANSISLKYNTVETGFSSVSELVNTPAPVSGTSSPLDLDGTLSANSVEVSQLVQFPTAIANYTGSATTGAGIGYFRWQYSSPGSGSRKGLSVTNIDMQKIDAGTDNAWTGASNDSWTASGKWTSPSTWTGTTYNAVFNTTTKSPADLQSSVNAVDLVFTDDFTITSTGGAPQITLSGIINVASGQTATLSVPLETAYGILKFGAGEAILNANNPSDNDIAIYEGTLTIGSSAVIDADNRMMISQGATLNVNDQNLTLDGLSGSAGSTVTLGNSSTNTLTLDLENSGSASYRGAITGSSTADTVLKTGPGVQRFRATTKDYYAKTQVDNGSLALTQNSGLPNTYSITLNGVTSTTADPDTHGDLLLSNDGSGGAKSFTLGGGVQIAVVSGSITADGSSAITLTNPISLSALDQPGTTAAHNNISASGANTVFTLSGVISGQEFRKVGAGKLHLSGSNTHLVTEIRNGTLIADSTTALNGAQVAGHDLYFADKGNDRTLEVQANTVVTYLDGNSPDPDDAGDAGYPQQATAFINIPSGKTFTVDYTAEVDGMSEEIKPSFQGNIGGVSSTYGTFIKDGTGTQRFTIWPKTFAGAYVVNQGVLQVSKNGEITGASGITVENGGQIRLSTGVSSSGSIALATYNFGGTLTLKSTSRATDGTITYPSGSFGVLGGLRFDPDTGIQYGALASNVSIAATSDIHINGTEKEFRLTGTLSGSSKLTRSGGGKLVIAGTSTGLSTGEIELINGATVINSGVTVGASTTRVVKVGKGDAGAMGDDLDTAEFGGAGSIYGAVTVKNDGLLSQGQVGSAWLPVGNLTVNGSLELEDDAVWVEDLDNADKITVSGALTLPETSGDADFIIDLNGSGEVEGDYLIGTASSSNFTSISLDASHIRNAPVDVGSATITYNSGTGQVRILLDY